ncbi:hypothetical protein LAZ67_10000976 [Cordylochernes scorpioides]|uniref:RNA-directed DNA polymerase n=1 Tax=Cordylochernes scorpioides TaxID=51811 RepID=A0ABY6KX39_9ARAC|nr:hypothetical protein LAZ67_10000976 [Cordylochernes scorpioides]
MINVLSFLVFFSTEAARIIRCPDFRQKFSKITMICDELQTITIQAWRRKKEEARSIPGEWPPSHLATPRLPGVERCSGGQDGGEENHQQLSTNIRMPRRRNQWTDDLRRVPGGCGVLQGAERYWKTLHALTVPLGYYRFDPRLPELIARVDRMTTTKKNKTADFVNLRRSLRLRGLPPERHHKEPTMLKSEPGETSAQVPSTYISLQQPRCPSTFFGDGSEDAQRKFERLPNVALVAYEEEDLPSLIGRIVQEEFQKVKIPPTACFLGVEQKVESAPLEDLIKREIAVKKKQHSVAFPPISSPPSPGKLRGAAYTGDKAADAARLVKLRLLVKGSRRKRSDRGGSQIPPLEERICHSIIGHQLPSRKKRRMGDKCNISEPNNPCRTNIENEDKRQNILSLVDDTLNKEKRSNMAEYLINYAEIFDFERRTSRHYSGEKLKIDTSDNHPIKQRPYRVSPTERRAIQGEVDKMIKMGVAQSSESPWYSPVVLVKKKDGSWRFCVDYRRLNRVTKKDVYPIPRTDDVFDSLTGTKFYSNMNLRTGHWHIEIDEGEREKTAFVTPDDLYEIRVMPFGLCNAPATFERMMANLVAGLKIIKVLGHLVSEKGIRPDPVKIEVIINFPTPKNTTDVRSFIGLCSYYRHFVRNFANKAKPLHELLKINTRIVWSKEQDESFQILKAALTTDPFLGHYKKEAETYLHTDASGHGIGAILIKIHEGGGKPIAYASKTLNAAEKNYSNDRERMSGRSMGYLQVLANINDPSGRLARWALRLQQFDISIVYKSGKKHQDADCLLRNPLLDTDENNIPELISITDVRKEQEKDDQITKKSKMRIDILREAHDSPMAGHLGFAKTYDRVRKKYFWPGLYRFLKQYMSHCRECQKQKGSTGRPPGQLVPIPPVARPFQRVGIDLLGRFPVSNNGNKWIVVATDYLSRYAMTRAISNGSAEEVAKFMIEDVLLKHGAPRKLISDRGRTFISRTLKEINDFCGTIHRITSAYHPQTNGLTERLNKTLSDMLSMYVDVEQRNGDAVLPYVTFAYNTSQQESTGEKTSLEDYVESMVANTEDARQLARLNFLRSQERDKSRYDQSHRPVHYQTGDLVWVFTPVRGQGLAEKLLKRYFCPYGVNRQLSVVTYEMVPLEKRPRQRKQKISSMSSG